MAAYRQLFHDMFGRVLNRLQGEIEVKQRQGIYKTMLRLPSVHAFSKLPPARTPPQTEVDVYIMTQLQKRNFIVRQVNENFIEVEWLHLMSQPKPPVPRKIEKPVDLAINKHPPHKTPIKTAPIKMPPPPRPIVKAAPPPPKLEAKSVAPSKQKVSKPLVPAQEIVPVLSNKVDKLDDRTEAKMAAVHQNVLRALAGV